MDERGSGRWPATWRKYLLLFCHVLIFLNVIDVNILVIFNCLTATVKWTVFRIEVNKVKRAYVCGDDVATPMMK